MLLLFIFANEGKNIFLQHSKLLKELKYWLCILKIFYNRNTLITIELQK